MLSVFKLNPKTSEEVKSIYKWAAETSAEFQDKKNNNLFIGKRKIYTEDLKHFAIYAELQLPPIEILAFLPPLLVILFDISVAWCLFSLLFLLPLLLKSRIVWDLIIKKSLRKSGYKGEIVFTSYKLFVIEGLRI